MIHFDITLICVDISRLWQRKYEHQDLKYCRSINLSRACLTSAECPVILLQYHDCPVVLMKSGDTTLKLYETYRYSWKNSLAMICVSIKCYFWWNKLFLTTKNILIHFFAYECLSPSLWTHCFRCSDKTVSVVDLT